MRYIRRSGKKAKQVRFRLVVTFYRLLFFRYNCLLDQLFFKYNCSRYGYSRCGCQMWRSCSPDVTIFQTWLFSRRGCSLDVAVLQWLFSRYGCFPVAVLQTQLPSTQLFSRHSCSLDVAVLQTWFFYLALPRGLVILGQLGIQ